MKKIIFTILFFTIFIPNSFALSKFYLGDKVPNMYIEEYDDYNFHNGAPFIIKRDDGAVVYCIDPFQKISTTDYYTEYNYNYPTFNITEEQIDKINLISYYGYNYYNHTDIKWYGITQFLIWKALNFTDIYFTDSYYGNRINAYEKEVQELESLVDSHYLLPSFYNNSYEYSTNSNYKIVDNNKVLSNYEILETNIDAIIINNELNINTKEDGIYEIKFIKKSPIEQNYLLYNLDGHQSLIYPGKIKDIVFSIIIEVNSGSVTINKIDSEGKKHLDATLKGAVYGFYYDNELITTVETNDKGIAHIDNLPLGEYYIKEITPSVGYELDTNIYYANITKENKNIIVNSYENIIKGNLIINKYYGNSSKYILEDKAKFNIYDSLDNLVHTYETYNGLIDEEIEYGDYYIVQVGGKNGYSFVDKFKISIREDRNYVFDLYDEEEFIVVDVPNTGVYSNNNIYFYSSLLILIGVLFILVYINKLRYCKIKK